MGKMFDISGKVAVVTGGGGTLGASIAGCLVKAGARVALLGRNPENLEQEAEKIRKKGNEVIILPADVLDMEQLKAARQKVLDTWGQIDILVNAAGGNLPGATLTNEQTIFDMKTEDYQKVTDLNLNGTVFPCLVFGEPMAQNGSGSIVNISSMSTFSAITRVPGYSVAKAGVEVFTKWLAMEMALKFGENIRVNCIAPGFFIGKQNRHVLLNADGSYTERSMKVINKTPMKRFGRMEELNGTVLYLCSKAASFVTGTVIPVDGGFSSFSGI
ncbi:MAG TPA: SDR family oxidoreductase [Prolixibacteraceae bacterium]|nr:SDR family oxidoreductase [Prolixibacteraceae bacterium]